MRFEKKFQKVTTLLIWRQPVDRVNKALLNGPLKAACCVFTKTDSCVSSPVEMFAVLTALMTAILIAALALLLSLLISF